MAIPYPSLTRDQFAAALARHVEQRDSGAAGEDAWMHNTLVALMRLNWHGCDWARHSVHNMLSGRCGPAVQYESLLTLTGKFDTSDSSQDLVWRAMSVCRGTFIDYAGREPSTIDVTAATARLLQQNAPWADRIIVELISGKYGTYHAVGAGSTLVAGFNESHPGAGVKRSFARLCMNTSRLPLFRAVAAAELSSALAAVVDLSDKAKASTTTGRWLDILANTSGDRSGIYPSFPELINNRAHTPEARVLAEILVALDAGHPDIDALAGQPGHSLIMEATMRQHVGALAPAAAGVVLDAAAAPAPYARRRARVV